MFSVSLYTFVRFRRMTIWLLTACLYQWRRLADVKRNGKTNERYGDDCLSNDLSSVKRSTHLAWLFRGAVTVSRTSQPRICIMRSVGPMLTIRSWDHYCSTGSHILSLHIVCFDVLPCRSHQARRLQIPMGGGQPPKIPPFIRVYRYLHTKCSP